MREITLSLSYYNDFEHIQNHFEVWKEYKDKIKFQIIDDGSTEKLIDIVDKEIIKNLEISIFTIKEDIKWNIPGVRNLGATVCDTSWILFCDMDQYFFQKDIELIIDKIKKNEIDKKNFYSFSRIGKERTAGTLLMTKESFWKCGGYDEELSGNYGYNDPLLRKQLESVGVFEETLSDVFCQQINADCKLDRNGISKNKKKMYKKLKKLPKKNIKILNFSWEKSI